MVGRTATSATWSGPFSSAIRRRASSSTSRGEVADPARRPCARRGLVVDAPSAEQRLHDPVDQLGGRRPAAAWCTPTSSTGPGPRPGIAPNRATASTASSLQRLLVAVGQRSASRSRNAARAPRPVVADAAPPVRVVAGSSPADALADQPREVEVEERVEGRPLGLPLDQGGGVRRAHGLAVVPVERARARRSRRGPRPATPAGPAARSASRKRDVRVEQAVTSGQRPSLQLLDRARRWSEACLRTTPSVSATAVSSRSPISQRDQGARPVDGLRDRRAPSSARARAAGRRVDQLARPPGRRGRAPGE